MDKINLNNENIPLFPLGIMVIPGEVRFLHIFEKRYRNLYEDIRKADNTFAIPFVAAGKMEGVGSLVKFERALAKYPNGEVDIAVKGVDLITLDSFYAEHQERLYPHGKITRLNKDTVAATRSLIEIFMKYNDRVLKLDLDKFPKINFYTIANCIGLNDLEKYDLLVREDDKAINKTLVNHLKLKTIIAAQHNALKDHYCLN